MNLLLRETMFRAIEFERSNSRCRMSYGGCSGEKEDLLQIAVVFKRIADTNLIL